MAHLLNHDEPRRNDDPMVMKYVWPSEVRQKINGNRPDGPVGNGFGCNSRVAQLRPQDTLGALEKINIVRAASTRVRFLLSTTPFCCGVLGTVF
ncbi:hypothetical protein Tco_0066725 [Tanacetum coccineum]